MLVSFYIITFNHSQYIEEALSSALSQTYSPLQIAISDDASTDDTCQKIEHLLQEYQGPHKITYLKNKKNLGIARHITSVLRKCEGEWIIASAGDDISENNRVELIIDQYRKNPELLLIQSYLREIDGDGKGLYVNTLNDDNRDAQNRLVRWSASERANGVSIPHTHGAGFAYSRVLLDRFGIELSEDIMFEDNVFDWRAEMLSAIGMIRIPLVRHRNHSGQATRADFSSRRHRIDLMKRIAASDIATTRLNIDDLSLLHEERGISDETFSSCMKWLQHRLSFMKMKYDVLSAHWPMRYYTLLRYMLSDPPKEFMFSRRDKYSLLLP